MVNRTAFSRIKQSLILANFTQWYSRQLLKIKLVSVPRSKTAGVYTMLVPSAFWMMSHEVVPNLWGTKQLTHFCQPIYVLLYILQRAFLRFTMNKNSHGSQWKNDSLQSQMSIKDNNVKVSSGLESRQRHNISGQSFQSSLDVIHTDDTQHTPKILLAWQQ